MGELQIDFFKETDRALMEWGRWCRCDGQKLSFSGLAPFAREMPREIESTLPIMEDTEALEIERAVLCFRAMNPGGYKLGLLHYVKRLTLHDAAKAMGISHSKARLERNAIINFTMGKLYEYSA